MANFAPITYTCRCLSFLVKVKYKILVSLSYVLLRLDKGVFNFFQAATTKNQNLITDNDLLFLFEAAGYLIVYSFSTSEVNKFLITGKFCVEFNFALYTVVNIILFIFLSSSRAFDLFTKANMNLKS